MRSEKGFRIASKPAGVRDDGYDLCADDGVEERVGPIETRLDALSRELSASVLTPIRTSRPAVRPGLGRGPQRKATA